MKLETSSKSVELVLKTRKIVTIANTLKNKVVPYCINQGLIHNNKSKKL